MVYDALKAIINTVLYGISCGLLKQPVRTSLSRFLMFTAIFTSVYSCLFYYGQPIARNLLEKSQAHEEPRWSLFTLDQIASINEQIAKADEMIEHFHSISHDSQIELYLRSYINEQGIEKLEDLMDTLKLTKDQSTQDLFTATAEIKKQLAAFIATEFSERLKLKLIELLKSDFNEDKLYTLLSSLWSAAVAEFILTNDYSSEITVQALPSTAYSSISSSKTPPTPSNKVLTEYLISFLSDKQESSSSTSTITFPSPFIDATYTQLREEPIQKTTITSNYASAATGATIVHEKTSPSYLFRPTWGTRLKYKLGLHDPPNGPHKTIENDMNCWYTPAGKSYITIKLKKPNTIDHVTIKQVLSDSSSPKQFSVQGTMIDGSTKQLGQFVYISKGKATQEFQVPASEDKFEQVTFNFENNWGHRLYTKVCNIGIYGTL